MVLGDKKAVSVRERKSVAAESRVRKLQKENGSLPIFVSVRIRRNISFRQQVIAVVGRLSKMSPKSFGFVTVLIRSKR